MANLHPATPEPLQDDDSNYGSDFSPEEAQIIESLLSPKFVDIEDNPILNGIEHHGRPSILRLPHALGHEQRSTLFQAARAAERVAEKLSDSVAMGQHYPYLSNQVREPPSGQDASVEVAVPSEPSSSDTRSPLERFRTPPKKALSVTDLVSPAWCELQYWYTLTIHGRKKRTPAMKKGSAVHQTLEDQIHTAVPVTTVTLEDKWGLRIWNVIQGLRTLRDTGQTRELEIWGTIDGLVVNGVIDDLNYVCPDTDLEESLAKSKTSKKMKEEPVSPDQVSITEFFKKAGGKSITEAARTQRRSQSTKIYICDVKTRSFRNLPNGASFKPTQMQLMLYHHLLSALATNTVDFSTIASRYGLDVKATFSDSFIAEVGSLNEDLFYDATSMPGTQDSQGGSSSQDSMTTLLLHNNLSLLWSLMITEFQLTLPHGAASLGNVLKAEYRSRDDGSIIGAKTIPMDHEGLMQYLDKEMRWWRGERAPEGVAVEEAFKCRSCDFAESCEWRLGKIQEAMEKTRLTRQRKTSVV